MLLQLFLSRSSSKVSKSLAISLLQIFVERVTQNFVTSHIDKKPSYVYFSFIIVYISKHSNIKGNIEKHFEVVNNTVLCKISITTTTSYFTVDGIYTLFTQLLILTYR